MFNFNSKASIQKHPTFCSWYNFFNTNVSDFTGISLQKRWHSSIIKLTCFIVYYYIFNYQKILKHLFFKNSFFDHFVIDYKIFAILVNNIIFIFVLWASYIELYQIRFKPLQNINFHGDILKNVYNKSILSPILMDIYSSWILNFKKKKKCL